MLKVALQVLMTLMELPWLMILTDKVQFTSIGKEVVRKLIQFAAKQLWTACPQTSMSLGSLQLPTMIMESMSTLLSQHSSKKNSKKNLTTSTSIEYTINLLVPNLSGVDVPGGKITCGDGDVWCNNKLYFIIGISIVGGTCCCLTFTIIYCKAKRYSRKEKKTYY